MIPEKAGNTFLPFLCLKDNPAKGKVKEINLGESVKILNEFDAPPNPRIKSPMMGEVELSNGEKRTVGINWNTYYEIAKSYGKDTFDWVGKEIVFKGMVQFEKGTGWFWSAK